MSGPDPTFFTKVREGVQARGLLARILSRRFATEAALLLAVAGACFVAAFFLSTRAIVRSGETVAVEDLVGRDAGDAAVWLAGHGLVADIDHFENNDRAVPLTVLFQQPAAGEDLRPGNIVRLVIAKGARTSPVPDVRGNADSQARLILERNGLVTADEVGIHDPLPAGSVLATSPGPNAGVLAGSAVRLLVSLGPAPRRWVTPDITWQLYDGVTQTAAAMGVPLEVGQHMHAADEPEGAILEQFPGAGTRLIEGQPLRVTLNGDARIEPPQGGTNLVTLSILVPRGLSAKDLVVTVARGPWIRTLFEESVEPGERVRLVAAVLPGDRAVATLDGRSVLVRTF